MSKLSEAARNNILDMENIANLAKHNAVSLDDKVRMGRLEKTLARIYGELRLMHFEFVDAEIFAETTNKGN